jgi:hypothetical protein
MPKTIDQAYITTFESNVRHLAQQKRTLVRNWVEERHEESESHNWETLNAQEGSDIRTKPGGLSDTPDHDEIWQKRRTNTATYDTGNSVQHEDPIQMLVDPNSALVQRQAMAMQRKIDDILIGAAFADASIKGSQTPVAFPASQELGLYTAELDFDLVTAVTEKFLENDVDPDEEKVMFIGPKQARKLLHLLEATSADYNLLRPLQEVGMVNNWMGYTWVVTNRLNAPAADQLDLICMTRRAMGLHVARDVTTKVAEDPSKSFAWRIYSYMSMDAVRVEDQHIVKVKVADTFTA